MSKDKHISRFCSGDILLTVLSVLLTTYGIITYSIFGQKNYLLIVIGVFILFFNIWRQVKRLLKGDGKNQLLLIVNVFALALAIGIIFGYFLLGLIQYKA